MLKEVNEKVLPELNDDFAQLVGDFSSLDDLRERTRQGLKSQAEHAAEHRLEDEALAKAVDGAKIAFPPPMLERELDRMVDEQDEYIRREQNIGLEDYLKMMGQNKEDYRKSLIATATARLKRSLVLSELGRLEKLTASEEDMEAQRQMMLQAFPQDEPNVRAFLNSEAGQIVIRRDVLSHQALERLGAIARGEAPALETEDSVSVTEAAPAESVAG